MVLPLHVKYIEKCELFSELFSELFLRATLKTAAETAGGRIIIGSATISEQAFGAEL